MLGAAIAYNLKKYINYRVKKMQEKLQEIIESKTTPNLFYRIILF